MKKYKDVVVFGAGSVETAVSEAAELSCEIPPRRCLPRKVTIFPAIRGLWPLRVR